jgi:hypothetical protein
VTAFSQSPHRFFLFFTKGGNALTLNSRELATILASLRFFQEEFCHTNRDELARLFPHFSDQRPLSTEEVSTLCERLNAPESAADANLPSAVAVETPGQEWLASELRSAIQRAQVLQQMILNRSSRAPPRAGVSTYLFDVEFANSSAGDRVVLATLPVQVEADTLDSAVSRALLATMGSAKVPRCGNYSQVILNLVRWGEPSW